MGGSAGRETNRHMAWCGKCKEDFVTYNLATAICPRCGGKASTQAKRKAKGALALLVVLALLAGGGAIAYYMFLR